MSEDQDLNLLVTEDEVLDGKEPPLEETPELIHLMTRLVYGLASIGSEGFVKIIQDANEKTQSRSYENGTYQELASEDDLDQLRYLLYGVLYNTQKRVRRGIQRGFRFSLRVSGAVFGTFYALTDNRILKPVRRPVDRMMSNIARDADQVVRIGRNEEQQSRALAVETLNELLDQVVEFIATNPKMTRAINEVVGGQGVGMSQVLLDGINNKVKNSDYILEGFIRKLLRMTPRTELPESPIMGKPQFMYLPEEYTTGDIDLDEGKGL